MRLPLIIFCLIGLNAAGADYARDIKPLFAERCLECHGPDKQKGGLRLDRALDKEEAAIADGELIRRLTSDDPDERMPPKGPRLKTEEINAVKTWIENDAPFERHWAYLPLNTNPPPTVKNKDWCRNPIDHFVLANLESQDIAPSPEADRSTLIRRLYYDLIGLPPTPKQSAAFVADKSPNAYEKVVDQLLASPHFGERWGRHWLDKARYADSDGYEKDRPRPEAWRYRDWVINAINDDIPFDRFTIEQLAGDLLPEPTRDQKIATAFHRQTLTNTEGGTDKEQFRVEAVFDRTETTGSIWLGLTIGCARCHTHKYDAISIKEYFQLYAFFNDGEESNLKVVTSEAAMEKYTKAIANYQKQLAEINRRLSAAEKSANHAFLEWERKTIESTDRKQSPRMHLLNQVAVSSNQKDIQFKKQDDASWLVPTAQASITGPLHYHVSSHSNQIATPVTALRLEAISDKALPSKGPGLTAHGNFVVNEVRLKINDEEIPLTRAKASFYQKGFDPEKLIDKNLDARSGWAISPQMGKSHDATLYLKTPLIVKPKDKLEFEIIHTYGSDHYLGRFRVQLMTGQEAKTPADILTTLKRPADQRTKAQVKKVKDYFHTNIHPETSRLTAERDKLIKSKPKEPSVNVRVISPKNRDTHILERGDFLSPGERVSYAAPEVLPPIQPRLPEKAMDRLDLAHWLMSEENPLPPRVLTNHIWTHLFGAGLVRTNNDFGVRGERPSHPALLDWLGLEFRRLGWSRKALIRTIVTSATYRQASRHRDELVDIDANNRLLARQNRFRVEAEILRDISLELAGLLSKKIGGPSVYPPLPPSVAELSYANNFKWKTSVGEDRYRRGIYTFFKRTSPHPNLIAFDCPDANTTNIVRRTSNTPIQALTILNNEVFVEAAQALANRFLAIPAKSDAERLKQAIQLCIIREPTDHEIEQFDSLLKKAKDYYAREPEEAKKLAGEVHLKFHSATEAAAWTALARIALNLDEVMTRE